MIEGKNNSNNNGNFNYDNDVVAAKELHKFSRPTLAAELEAEAGRLESLWRVRLWLEDQKDRGPFRFICDRGAVISCRQIVALYLLRAADAPLGTWLHLVHLGQVGRCL